MKKKKFLSHSIFVLLLPILILFLDLTAVSTNTASLGSNSEFLPLVTSLLPDQWIKHFDMPGATTNVQYNDVTLASNNDLFLVGEFSTGGQSSEAVVARISSSGDPMWNRVFSTASRDRFTTIALALDGGLWVGGDFHDLNDDTDYPWLVRLNQNGVVLWQKTYLPVSIDPDRAMLQDILATPDGGALISIESQYDGAWIVKLTSNGSVSWVRSFGQFPLTFPLDYIQPTLDDGFILAGNNSFNGERLPWVVKLNSDGTVAWQKVYGLTQTNDFESHVSFGLTLTNDGGYILGVRSYRVYESWAIWILRLNSNGGVIWQKSFDIGNSQVQDMTLTADQGLVIIGADLYVSTVRPWIFKINSSGSLLWKRHYISPPGTQSGSGVGTVAQMSNGDIIVGGGEIYQSNQGFGAMRLTAQGTVPSCSLLVDAQVTTVATGFFEQSFNAPVGTVTVAVANANISSTTPSLTSELICP